MHCIQRLLAMGVLWGLALGGGVPWPGSAGTMQVAEAAERPNILLCIADDWGWPHAGAYGDPVVKTPAFDRLAREGVLFHHAYVSSPSCTPSRGAILTGQWHWRLEGAANLWSEFPDKFATYPELLEAAGYVTGTTGKNWGPGRAETPRRPLAGHPSPSFAEFLRQRPKGKPFCFWLGSSDPHRPYDRGSGAASGMDLSKIRLPACFPDHAEVRGDVADYYFEVQRFDALVGSALRLLEQAGELENTLIVVTGDHGMPFPRCKSNLYDTGTRVPLVVRWGSRVSGGRQIEDFVSLTDLAPTFLQAAGLQVPDDMTGRSLLPLLNSDKSGRVASDRGHVLFGKERHVPAQEAPDMGGYPCRGIRTHDYLYIRNFRPDRWPNGTPDYERAAVRGAWYADTDNGPTKSYMIEHRDDDPQHRRLYELSFAKRPAEELYDLRKDPDQLHNVADDPAYAQIRQRLAAQLEAELRASGDPRIVGGGEKFDEHPYLGGAPRHPSLERPR
jgi:N-sulfoglucosamine sulfohydrolase